MGIFIEDPTGVPVIDAIISSAVGHCWWGSLRLDGVPTNEPCGREDTRTVRVEDADGAEHWLSLCAGHAAALDGTGSGDADAPEPREYTDDGRRIVQPGDLHRLSNRDERSSHDVWPAMPVVTHAVLRHGVRPEGL